MPSPLTVIKIGGSLLRSGDDLHRAAAAVAERRRCGETLLVVVSALNGVTDLLERMARRALDPRPAGERAELLAAELRRRHEEIARGLDDAAFSQLQSPLDELASLIRVIRGSAQLSERRYARLLSLGERMSVPLMAAAIRARGQDARAFTSEELGLRAAGPRRAGRCDLAASAAGFRRLRAELDDRVAVLTGFYGHDRDGEVVLFGRGGSDDTAGAVAAGLEAAALELWKDVPGFMSADPRHVASARLVPELSFDEVAQLGEFGSRIVHAGSLEPLRGQRAEIRICGLGGSGPSGTRVLASRPGHRPSVAALMTRQGKAEFHLQLPENNGYGFTGEILARAGEAEIAVETIATPRGSVQFTVAESDARRVETILRGLGQQRVSTVLRTPLVGVVGDRVASEPAIGDRMRERLARLQLRGDLEVTPAGHAGLSCALHHEDLVPALHGLHELFFES